MGWFRTHEEDVFNTVPIGLDEFRAWTDDVIALTRLPSNDSMRFAVASIVLENKDILSKKDCAKRLVKAAQNQLAAFVFQDIKGKRMDADRAAAEKIAQEKADAEAKACPPLAVVAPISQPLEAPAVNAEGAASEQCETEKPASEVASQA